LPGRLLAGGRQNKVLDAASIIIAEHLRGLGDDAGL